MKVRSFSLYNQGQFSSFQEVLASSMQASFITLDQRIEDGISYRLSNNPIPDVPPQAPVSLSCLGQTDPSCLTPRILHESSGGEHREPELGEQAVSPNFDVLASFISQAEQKGLVVPQGLLLQG